MSNTRGNPRRGGPQWLAVILVSLASAVGLAMFLLSTSAHPIANGESAVARTGAQAKGQVQQGHASPGDRIDISPHDTAAAAAKPEGKQADAKDTVELRVHVVMEDRSVAGAEVFLGSKEMRGSVDCRVDGGGMHWDAAGLKRIGVTDNEGMLVTKTVRSTFLGVLANKAGVGFSSWNLASGAGTAAPIEVELELQPLEPAIHGRVVTCDGVPIVAAEVMASCSRLVSGRAQFNLSCATDSSGRFKLPFASQWPEASVQAKYQGQRSTHQMVDAFRLTEDLVLEMAGRTRVQGVVRSTSGALAAGVRVNAWKSVNVNLIADSGIATTDANGQFELLLHTTGSFQVVAYAHDGETPGIERTVELAELVPAWLDLVIQEPMTLTGLATFTDSGQPCAGLVVRVAKNDGGGMKETTADQFGRFELRNLARGVEYMVIVVEPDKDTFLALERHVVDDRPIAVHVRRP